MLQQREPVQFRNERQVIQLAGRQAINSFLESQTCFSVLRASAKVVVFDIRIPIQLAFYALVEHGRLIYFNSVLLRYYH
jgi:5'-AMP-activated protein kinase, regulatory gamma subunit